MSPAGRSLPAPTLGPITPTQITAIMKSNKVVVLPVLSIKYVTGQCYPAWLPCQIKNIASAGCSIFTLISF